MCLKSNVASCQLNSLSIWCKKEQREFRLIKWLLITNHCVLALSLALTPSDPPLSHLLTLISDNWNC